MAKLPTTLGQRAVPRPRRGVASVTPGIEARGYQQAAEIADRTSQRLAGDLQSASDSLYRAEQEKANLSLANAKSRFLRDQIAIETEFDKDQDWATFGTRYDDRVKKAKAAAAESISDPRARAAFEADADIDIARGSASIGSKARAKETDSARATLNETIDQNMQASLLLPNTDKVGQARLFKATGDAIDASFRSGYISAQEAQQQKSMFAEKYAASWISKLPPEERLQHLVPPAAPNDGFNRSPVGVRRLAPGEYVQNADGSRSTERSITVTHPNLNGGKPTNIPSIWMVDGKIVELLGQPNYEDRAVEFALQTGEKWQSYGSIAEAETAAKKRSDAGARFSDATPGGPLPPVRSDADYLTRVAALESGGDPNAKNPQSGALGMFQFMPETAKQYGLTDPTDIKASTEAAARFTEDNRRILRATLGREPSPAELYLAHQQGATGASALLENPDQLAISTLAVVYGSYDKAKAAILQNGGHENMTAGQFASLWMTKFDGKPTVLNQNYEIPSGGYDFSQKTGTAVDFLPVDKRMALIESSLIDLKQQQDKARVGAQVDVNLSYGDWQRNAELTGSVDPLSSAKIMAAYPDERGAKMVAGLTDAAETGKLTKIVNNQTLADDDNLLTAAIERAKVPGDGSSQALADLERLAKVVAAKDKAIAEDPAAYVSTVNPAIGDAWKKAAGEGATPADKQMAVAMTKTEQERIGVPPSQARVMPKSVASAYVEQFSSVKPEDAADMIEGMARDFGPQWGDVLRDLTAANLPGYAVVLGSLDKPDHAMFRTNLIEANKLGSEQINKLVPETARKDVTTALDEALADFNQTLAVQSGGPEMAATYQDAIKSVALYSMIKGQYTDPADAAEAAANSVIGQYQVYDTYRVPDIYDGEAVENGLYQALTGIKTGDIAAMGSEFSAGLSDQFLADETARGVIDNAFWVTNENETGAYLVAPGGSYIRRADGTPFMVTFLEAEKAQPRRPGVDRDLNKGGIQ